MAINFNDVLNKKASDIEKPLLLPMGTYRATVSKVPAMDTVGKDGEWDTLDFPMHLISAGEDVDQEELNAATKGGLNKNKTIRNLRFMFNKNDQVAFDKTLYRLKKFLLEHLKIEGNDDTPLKELLNNSLNQQCDVFIKWTPDKNDQDMQYDQISKTAPIE